MTDLSIKLVTASFFVKLTIDEQSHTSNYFFPTFPLLIAKSENVSLRMCKELECSPFDNDSLPMRFLLMFTAI